MYPILLYLLIGVCVVVINIRGCVSCPLFSLIFSCLCCYPAEDQLSSSPYTSFHRARDALLRVYADPRSVFVR